MNETPTELLLGALLTLLLLSSFFSSSETALLSLDRLRLERLARDGHKGAKRARALLQRKDHFLGLVLIGNNIVNIGASVLATLISLRLLGDSGPLVAATLLTFYVLIFAEIMPKTFAALRPESVAFPASALLRPLSRLFAPLVRFFSAVSNAPLRLLKIDMKSVDAGLDRLELKALIDSEQHQLSKDHSLLLGNVLDLEEVRVADIMIPRNRVAAVDLNSDRAGLIEELSTSVHHYLLVYENELENIRGVLDARDIALLTIADGKINLQSKMHAPYFVPERASLLAQLENFRRSDTGIGVVVDEYGAMQGVITLHDILSEIVGSINLGIKPRQDEPGISFQGDDGYMIDGSISLREINRQLNWNLHGGADVTTLNGLIVEYLEGLPSSSVGFRIGDYLIEVIGIRDNQVSQAKVRQHLRKPAPETDDN